MESILGRFDWSEVLGGEEKDAGGYERILPGGSLELGGAIY